MSEAQLSEQYGIPCWLTDAEVELLAQLATEVPAGGTIVEVGSLYGGSTAVIAKAAPAAKIIAVDEFSWSPLADVPASRERLRANLDAAGVHNVSIQEGDSRRMLDGWHRWVDLAFIDGGHSYEFVRADLENIGRYAKVVVLHDWDNPFWPTIKEAAEHFMRAHPRHHFCPAEGADTLRVLRRADA